jgi:hypothetical protein
MKQKYYLSIAVGAGIIAIAACGIVAWQGSNMPIASDPMPIPEPQPTPQTSEQPSEDMGMIIDEPVEEWKIYRDKALGYSVKYPMGYVVHKYIPPCGSKRNDIEGKNVIFWNEDFLETHDTTINRVTDFNIFINDPNDTCVNGHYSSIGGNSSQTYKLVHSKTITVNGYDVLKRDYIDITPVDSYEAFTFSTWRFKNNGIYYTLLYNNGVTVNPEPQLKVFEEFLSTFTFLD